jgi:hypothetical protein
VKGGHDRDIQPSMKIAFSRANQQNFSAIVLKAQEQSQEHHYARKCAHARTTLVLELGAQIKPTVGSTTLTKVKKFFCKDMNKLLNICYEIDTKFQNFIVELMKVSSITFVTS